MASKKDKGQLLSFLIEEIDKNVISGTIEKNYSSILEDGRAVGISSYTINLLAKTAVLQNEKSPDIEQPVLPASFIYTHLSQEETKTIKSLEDEVRRLKKNPIVKRDRTTLLVASVFLLIIAGFLFLSAAGLAVENNVLSEELTATKDSLNTVIGELYQQNDSLSKVVSNLKSVKFSVGSNKRPSSPGKDRSWVEWIEVKAPLKIESFYTWASSTGGATIIAYNAMHQKVAETRVSVNGGSWQKVNLKNFNLRKNGKYYLSIEDTSVDFAFVSSNDNDYALYKQGPLQMIGATSRDTANKDNPSIGTGYYQYFFSIQYSLL